MAATIQEIPNPIKNLLTKEKLFTLATSRENIPFCAQCFYCFWEDEGGLILKSKKESLHIQNGLINPNVAGSITPPANNVITVKGIQFTGEFKSLSKGFRSQADWLYHSRFPFAMTILGNLWFIKLNYLKLIDKNSLKNPIITWSLNEMNQEAE